MELPQRAVPEREAARLAALLRLEVLDTPGEEAFDGIVRMAAKLCAAPMAAIGLVDASRIWFKARSGLAAREVPRTRAFCSESIGLAPQDVLIVRDAAADPRFAGHPLVAGEAGVRFYAGTPLITRGGEALGSLCVMDRVPRDLGDDQSEALTALAEQVIAELELRASRSRFAQRYRSALLTAAPAPGDHLLAERLNAAFEHLRESIVLTDPEDRFVLTNRAFRELNHNVAHAIQPGKKFSDYMRAGLAAGNYPDAAGKEEEWLEARLAERRNPGTPVERQRSGGRWFLIDDRRLPDGSTIRFGTEITDRKRAEAVLSERNRDLQLVINSVPVMITRLDRNERFLYANRAYTELMQLPAEEIVGRKVADVISPEAYAQIKPSIDRALSGDPVSVERIQRRTNGELIELEGRYIPDVDVKGRVIGLIAVHRDVTPERRAGASLATSEARFRGAFQLGLIGMAITSPDKKFVDVNNALCRMLGYPRERLVDTPWTQYTHPDDLPMNMAQMEHALAGTTEAYSMQKRYLRADGSIMDAEVAVSCVRDAGGPLRHFVLMIQDITERKRAEQTLLNSEARFRSLTALTSDWYWEQDAQFRYVFISEEADARGAVGMKARAGKTRWELPWSGVSDAQWAAHRAQLEAHEVFHDFEIQRPGPDGAPVWVSVSGEPIFDAQGQFTGYRGITRNITERKVAEQLLRLEHQVTRALSGAEDAAAGVREILRVVCESVGMGCGRFFKLDEAAGVLRFHDGWCLPQPAYQRFLENSRHLAFRPGEGLAGIIWQTGEPIWSSDTSRDPRVLGKSLAMNSDIRAAFAFAVRSEGKVLGVLSFSGQSAREPDERLLQAASVIGSQAGQFLQRKQAEQALGASEARFRAIFERSSAGMAITDAHGTYLSVNAAFARFFGYSTDEIVGNLKVSDLRSPEDAEGAALYQRLVSGEIGFFERERQYRRKDGVQIWGHATVSAVRDAGGTATYVVAVFSDITEKVLARARIERMNAELEERVETRTAELREALKELDAFTYSVSHDLRAPVGAVSGFAHLLRSAEAERLSEDGRRLLDFIEHNADRMTRLIEGLLRFSRLGRSELRRTRVSMNGLAGESLLDFVDEVARARVNAGAMPDCEGDPALLGQVWSNLVGNALKYSRNADAPCIDIGWDAVKRAYYVRDNGVGFDMAYAGKLFGVFERLHHESEFEGSGIGLAIVERIVRLHGGSIWADAAPGRGATFWFRLPA